MLLKIIALKGGYIVVALNGSQNSALFFFKNFQNKSLRHVCKK